MPRGDHERPQRAANGLVCLLLPDTRRRVRESTSRRLHAHFPKCRVTEHFRKRRAFLLGDAAHIHSPAGGQGMNTGMATPSILPGNWRRFWPAMRPTSCSTATRRNGSALPGGGRQRSSPWPGDRRFESISLQRRVCKPSVPHERLANSERGWAQRVDYWLGASLRHWSMCTPPA